MIEQVVAFSTEHRDLIDWEVLERIDDGSDYDRLDGLISVLRDVSLTRSVTDAALAAFSWPKCSTLKVAGSLQLARYRSCESNRQRHRSPG